MLVCIDSAANDSRMPWKPWQKDWMSLQTESIQVEIMDLPQAVRRSALMNATLLLIHGSVFDNPLPAFEQLPPVTKAILSHFDGCIGVVTAGGYADATISVKNGFCEGRIMDEGKVCFLRTSFPADNLAPLALRVARLIGDLAKALAIKDPCARRDALIQAWGEFDRERDVRAIVAFSVLCQGYLAVQLKTRKSEVLRRVSDGRMGQQSLKAINEYVSRYFRSRDSADLLKVVESPSYWAAFEGYDNLEQKVRKEWGEDEEPDGRNWEKLTPLIELVAKGGAVTSSQTALVVDAHYALLERLGAEQ